MIGNKSFPKKIPTPMSVAVLAEKVGGKIELMGTEGMVISSVASPGDAEKGSLVFCKDPNIEKCQEVVDKTKASAIITAYKININPGQGLILVEDPMAWYIRALNELFRFDLPRRIHSSAEISNDVAIGLNVGISAGVFIDKGCIIGDNCLIGVNCYLGPGTILGKNVFIQSNASIGGVGLGYHITDKNERLFFPHLGSAIIGDDVVIGSGTVIVRGQMDDTVIGHRTRIGNLVNVGHNVTIGEDCAVSSGTCIAGGTKIGARCNIGAGVTINAKLKIEEDCQIGLGSVVTKKIQSGKSVFGCPAKPLPTMRRF
jgi:UDP-3-O-[3-hydroxymyristoyl] glucosamine N-acyltransferase